MTDTTCGCPTHGLVEGTSEWEERYFLLGDYFAQEHESDTSIPCPVCLRAQSMDVKKAHELLDGMGIPRKKARRVYYTLSERIWLLMNHEGSLSELRVS